MKNRFMFSLALVGALLVGACQDDAQVADQNLVKAADNFELMRRVSFYNTWTDTVVMSVEGKCSILPAKTLANTVKVVCKTGEGKFTSDLVTVNENMTIYQEQMAPVKASVYHYRRTWKPQTLLPDIDFRGSTSAAVDALTPDGSD